MELKDIVSRQSGNPSDFSPFICIFFQNTNFEDELKELKLQIEILQDTLDIYKQDLFNLKKKHSSKLNSTFIFQLINFF